MTVLYTGREPFNQAFPKEGLTWEEFKVWNGFSQMKELLSLDQFLNPELNILKMGNNDAFSYHEQGKRTGLFTSLEYVKGIIGDGENCNLLAVIKEPGESCNELILEGFEFAGYDLLDTGYGYSALSNLGSILGPVTAEDLNEYGLIQNFSDVKALQAKICNGYRGLQQAETYIMAVWRHKKIGRGSSELIKKELEEMAC
ncbi:hypothetical protein [Lunatibacter salilacus]|uniref:hypothetical protein n=1 Tax=Lunatibacter salilacus TaxID=2483804 RepID=UPI00131B4A42|nr:hypothetical protein [Lunatibacter salilacus]